MLNETLHYVLVSCNKCNHHHEHLAVIDDAGEDCNLFDKLDQVKRDLRENPRFCECGERLLAMYSSSVIDQHNQ